MKHPRIEHWDDERPIGNSLIVTLAKGWRFNVPGPVEHVRGFDKAMQAIEEVRRAVPCKCEECAKWIVQ